MGTVDHGPLQPAGGRQRAEGLPRLLVLLVHALLARLRAGVPPSVSRIGMTCCGVVLMIVPLALWVAWSKAVLFAVLVICVAAIALLLVFVDVLKELPATLILRPFNFNTLAVRAYELASDERLADAAPAALTIVVIGILPVILLSRSITRSRHEHTA